MIKYAQKDLRDMFREQLKEYKASVGPMTPEERKELDKWADSGHSPYDNPYLLYGGDGTLMGFIDAMRTAEDMLCNHEGYYWGCESEPIQKDGEPPF